MSGTTTTADPNTTTTTAVPKTQADVDKIRKQNTDRLVQSFLKKMNSRPEPGAPEAEFMPLAVIESENMQITHAELSAIVDKYPDHPIAKTFRDSLKRTPSDDHPLTVERIHLEAIFDNKGVETEEVIGESNGKKVRIHRRKLVPLAN